MKKLYSEHHVIPRSRGGEKYRTVLLPKLFHTAWHIVFGNLKREEILAFTARILSMMEKQHKITAGELEQIRTNLKEGK